MALFKKEKPEVVKQTTKNTRELEELSKMFSENPTEVENSEKDNVIEKATEIIEQDISTPIPLLNSVKGTYNYIDIRDLTVAKNCVKTDELIVRENDGTYEIIGMAPVNAKIIKASKEETSLMILDYVDKTQGLDEKGKINLYKYELQNPEIIKKLSGKTPAELNGYKEEEFAGLVLKSKLDDRLKNLPTNVIMEISKLSPEMQAILARIAPNIGANKLSIDAVRALSEVPANENAVLMKLLQF